MSFAIRKAIVLLIIFLTAGCGKSEAPAFVDSGRWYTAEQAEQGHALFQTHCASCHGDQAQGLADDWRKTDAQGNYPPPPLNGSAHAWHHPLVVLETTIKEGGIPVGGTMPGFAAILSDDEMRSTIAYFQSLWADEIYARWAEIDER